ncbi:MAG: hypothetical protein KL863_10435 [Rhizobium sp.]|nr:hypothetical protein [Rhizobium sp.]
MILFQIISYMLAAAVSFGLPGGTPLAQVAITSFLLIPALLIFWGAGAIVDVLAPKPSETVPEGPVTLSQLQAIAFSAAGAYIIYLALNHTIGFIAAWHFVRQSPGAGPIPVTQILQPVLSWVVGIYLLVGGPGLLQLVGAVRRAGPRDA